MITYDRPSLPQRNGAPTLRPAAVRRFYCVCMICVFYHTVTGVPPPLARRHPYFSPLCEAAKPFRWTDNPLARFSARSTLKATPHLNKLSWRRWQPFSWWPRARLGLAAHQLGRGRKPSFFFSPSFLCVHESQIYHHGSKLEPSNTGEGRCFYLFFPYIHTSPFFFV